MGYLPLDQVVFFYEDCPTKIKDVTFENTKDLRQIPQFNRYNFTALPYVAIAVTVATLGPTERLLAERQSHRF